MKRKILSVILAWTLSLAIITPAAAYGETVSQDQEILQGQEILQEQEIPQEQKMVTASLNGWKQITGKWYYYDEDGQTVTGWNYIGGVWYYMDQSGVMATGWQQVGSTWYYMNGSGAMVTGWQQIGNTWYYMNESGAMATGWQQIGNTWYYMNGSGAMATGWQQIGNTWYYMNESGAMATGWQQIGNTWYYMNESGAMATGWQQIGNTWYYMNESGAMATGWQQIGHTWYYMNGSGAMTTGWQQIGHTWYYMNGSGEMMTGWQQIHGKWYYFIDSGAMATSQWIGNQGIGGYYIDQDGNMVCDDTYSLGNIVYRFDSSGKCIESSERYFWVKDPNGKKYKVESQYAKDPIIGKANANGHVITEEDFVAATAYTEGAVLGIPGMTGIALVLYNRTIDPDKQYPSQVDTVVYHARQFEVVRNGNLVKCLNEIEDPKYDDARKAARAAKAKTEAYLNNKTPRTVDEIQMPEGKKDFNYCGFMTVKAFEQVGLDYEKTEACTYTKGRWDTVFYTRWIKKQ